MSRAKDGLLDIWSKSRLNLSASVVDEQKQARIPSREQTLIKIIKLTLIKWIKLL